LVVVVLGVLESYRGYRADVCAEQAEKINLALRLCVGHVDDEVVALGAADVGEANAGVAGGSFYYGSAGLEKTAVLSILDNIESSAIFD
jgi:hypothetical protein